MSPEREDFQLECLRYLDRIGVNYFYDRSSGLYRYRFSEKEQDNPEARPNTSQNPLWVDIRRDWLVIAISLLTLAGLGLTVYYSKKQWEAVNNQYPEIKRSADAAKSAADTADGTLKFTKQSFIQDQRPYIAETKGSGGNKPFLREVDNGKVQIVWNYGMTNYGKSPASNIVVLEQMKLLDGIWEKNAKNTDKASHAPPLVPNLDSMDSIFSSPLSPEVANKILQTEGGIKIRVRIMYTDATRGSYETSLCYSDSKGLTGYCKNDNYIH